MLRASRMHYETFKVKIPMRSEAERQEPLRRSLLTWEKGTRTETHQGCNKANGSSSEEFEVEHPL